MEKKIKNRQLSKQSHQDISRRTARASKCLAELAQEVQNHPEDSAIQAAAFHTLDELFLDGPKEMQRRYSRDSRRLQQEYREHLARLLAPSVFFQRALQNRGAIRAIT